MEEILKIIPHSLCKISTFSCYITSKINTHRNINVITKEADSIPQGNVIIATGPLSSEAITEAVSRICPVDDLHFYDAVAPIVSFDSIDLNSAFFASRYNKGTADYINCPLSMEEYEEFVSELVIAKEAEIKNLRILSVCKEFGADKETITERMRKLYV